MLLVVALALTVMGNACKRRSHHRPVQDKTASSESYSKPGKKSPQRTLNNGYTRIESAASGTAKASRRLSVEVVKQMQLGASIEAFFANVYTRQGTRKSYIATKIPCEVSQGQSRDEGDFDCKFMENDLDIDVRIHRKGPRTALVVIPGDPVGPHKLNCALKYDYNSGNRGPEATRDGSVLHSLQEVTCAE